MIGKLKGIIDDFYKNALILTVSGVGYKVIIPTRTLNKYTTKGGKITLHIHTYIREDILNLYGFETKQELALFESLLSIPGIGAKIALAVVSSGTITEISKAVVNADLDYFVNIPGIGKKSAQRLIVDLKSALGDETGFDILEISRPEYEEVIQALKQFGFKTSESRAALRDVKNKSEMTSELLLKEVLKILGK